MRLHGSYSQSGYEGYEKNSSHYILSDILLFLTLRLMTMIGTAPDMFGIIVYIKH